jgi:vacuolar protein sorting-associated protein 72
MRGVKSSATSLEEDQEPNTNSSSDDDTSEKRDTPVVESLIAGREKRATAGNRLSALVDREADDDLELLFAEDEDDVEFEGADVEDQSDVQFESSDEDDEDQGPAGGNELEGEEELQKLAKEERQNKKRKAQQSFFKTPTLRKKVKIDPTTATAAPTMPAPRPKKKSERISWIPTPAEGPTRSSSRTLSVRNKEVVHERLVESEKRRLRTLALMEAASKKKDKAKQKVMTQEERLAEAERTEKLNSKSLNRWEETEKKRIEEQKAKLAALHNRRLDGPVITWWSGFAEWVNGKLSHVGRKVKAETGNEVGNRKKANADSNVIKPASATLAMPEEQDTTGGLRDPSTAITQPPDPAPKAGLLLQGVGDSKPDRSAGFLDGIHYYASLPEHMQTDSSPQASGTHPKSQPSAPKPVVEHSTRNLVILENFDPVAVRDREVQRRILFKRRTLKGQSKSIIARVIYDMLTNVSGCVRANARAVRDHFPTGQIPGSCNRPPISQFVCIQGDSEACNRQLQVEQLARVLCGTRVGSG